MVHDALEFAGVHGGVLAGCGVAVLEVVVVETVGLVGRRVELGVEEGRREDRVERSVAAAATGAVVGLALVDDQAGEVLVGAGAQVGRVGREEVFLDGGFRLGGVAQTPGTALAGVEGVLVGAGVALVARNQQPVASVGRGDGVGLRGHSAVGSGTSRSSATPVPGSGHQTGVGHLCRLLRSHQTAQVLVQVGGRRVRKH